jgi:tetratricopeptide (TPR) repeat protein
MRVSATLIVRDESAFIEDCLSSLLGFVDEIVMVDTGSCDDTVEKALRFPIKLHRFEWFGDFSAARNFAIDKAGGEWILYIDADEQLDVANGEHWREILDDKDKAGWKLRFYPRVGWTPYSELRLFRNDPRIRFRGVIHERIYEGVEAVCSSDRMEIGLTKVALRHFGYESLQRHKIERNIPLLQSYLASDPTRVYCWWHLGEMLLQSGDEEGAMQAWTRALDYARQGKNNSNAMPFFSLILLKHSRGADVDDLLEEAVSLFPEHLALRWLFCKHAVERGDGEKVHDILEALATIDPDTFHDPDLSYKKSLFSYAAPDALALCHFRAGRFEAATEWYRRAAVAAPDPRANEIRAQLASAKATAFGAGMAFPDSPTTGATDR